MIYRPLNVLPDNEYFAYGKTVKISWKNSGDTRKAGRIYGYNKRTDTLVYDAKEITNYIPVHEVTDLLEVGTYKYKIVVYNDIASLHLAFDNAVAAQKQIMDKDRGIKAAIEQINSA